MRKKGLFKEIAFEPPDAHGFGRTLSQRKNNSVFMIVWGDDQRDSAEPDKKMSKGVGIEQ